MKVFIPNLKIYLKARNNFSLELIKLRYIWNKLMLDFIYKKIIIDFSKVTLVLITVLLGYSFYFAKTLT